VYNSTAACDTACTVKFSVKSGVLLYFTMCYNITGASYYSILRITCILCLTSSTSMLCYVMLSIQWNAQQYQKHLCYNSIVTITNCVSSPTSICCMCLVELIHSVLNLLFWNLDSISFASLCNLCILWVMGQ
jgi:hypothetical protein